MQTEITIKTLFTIFLRNLWIMLLSFLLLFVAAFLVFEYNKTPLYEAEATMYISSKSPDQISQSTGTYNNASTTDLNTAKQLISTYSIVLKSDYAIDAVSEAIGNGYDKDKIRDAIHLAAVDDTEVMSITATTESPTLSADICNAIIKVGPDILKDKVKVGTCEVIDVATVPTKTSNPRSFKIPAVAGLAGAVLAFGIALLVYLLDTKIRSVEEFKSSYDLVILGEIPDMNDGKKHRNKNGKYYQVGRY